MEILTVIIWFVLCLIIAEAGNKRSIGYWGAFFVSLLLSPLIGLICVLVSEKNSEKGIPLSDNLAALIIKARKKFDKGEYDESLQLYLEVVTTYPISPQSNYMIACINSLKGNVQECYKYIDKAMEQGFKDFEKFKTATSLENFRNDKGFKDFALNGYRLLKGTIINSPSKFDELEKLGKLKESGVLSQEEFESEKAKILSA
jgi:hypothetical protein